MKKYILIFGVMAAFNANADTSGYCGPKDENGNFSSSCTYVYNAEDKTLTISGTGQMADVESPWGVIPVPRTYMPWRSLDYETGVINEGITTISNNAFTDSNVKNVQLPESMTSIGEGAFHQSKLENINLPNSITEIGAFALSNILSFSSVTLPENLTSLTERVLYANPSMTSIAIPESVTNIDPQAFAYLDGHGGSPLTEVYCSKAQEKQCETALAYRGGDNIDMIVYDTEDGVYQLNGINYASAANMSQGGESCGTDIDVCKAQVLKIRGACSDINSDCAAFVASAKAGRLLKVGSKTYSSLDALMKGNYDRRRIYTIEEANFVAGEKNRVSIRYR